MTPKEFEVLVFFIQHKDVAISRDRLLAAVWGFEYEGESRTIDIHIQQLRKKLNLKDKLVTIPKLGYRLESAKELSDETLAENIFMYFGTGDACCEHNQYFVIG